MHILDALIEADQIIDEIDEIVTDKSLGDAERVARIDALLTEYRKPV